MYIFIFINIALALVYSSATLVYCNTHYTYMHTVCVALARRVLTCVYMCVDVCVYMCCNVCTCVVVRIAMRLRREQWSGGAGRKGA